MKKIFKRLLIALFIIFLLLQFFPRPQKNDSGLMVNDIHLAHFIPADVDTVLRVSCYDCHSNKTLYPWYYNIQPVALWMGNHVKDGLKELNFSEFATYSIRRQYKKLEEINEQVKEKEMPLFSYSLIHSNAKLNDTDKILIAQWATNLRDSMKASYPPDSLLRKNKKI